MWLKQNPFFRPLSVLMALFTSIGAISLTACGDDRRGARDKATQPDSAEYRQIMQQYDPAVEGVISGFSQMETAIQDLNNALDMDDSEVDYAIDSFVDAADGLLGAVMTLEDVETRLQGGSTSSEGRITQPLLFTTIAVGLTVYGAWKFGKKMKQLSDEVSAARKERDAASDDMMNDVDGGEERYTEATQKMKDKGVEAAEEFTKQAGEALLPDAVQTVLTIKDLAETKKDNVKVIATTTACNSAPDSSNCKITKGRTDSQGRFTVPADTQSLIISTPGKARIVIDEFDGRDGGEMEIKRGFIPIEEATPESVSANDRGEATSPKDSGVAGTNGYDPYTAGTSGYVVDAGREDGGDTVYVDASINTGTDAGADAGTDASVDAGPPDPDPANNTVLSGTYPDEPFNGMQIDYSISGVGPSDFVDTPGFDTTRVYTGALGSGTLQISGSVRQANGYGAIVNVGISVDGEEATDSTQLVTPGDGSADQWSFELSIPVPSGASSAGVSISMVGDYNAGTRGLSVSGTFTNPPPMSL